jgi:dTDP-glucose 4,6-dehydratase
MEKYGVLPLRDIQSISESFASEFQELESVNFVIVGASGFLGRWISTSLAYMQAQDLFRGRLYLLVRDKVKISEFDSLSTLPNRTIVPIGSMDETSFSHLGGTRTVVIYAASSTSNAGKPLEINPQSYLELPRSVIKFLPKHEVIFVHLSSGAVYTQSSRSQAGIPRSEKVQYTSSDCYTAEKLILEQWLHSKVCEPLMRVRNPRLFTFYGQGLQLDRHFVIGEFMRNAIRKMPIVIKGNPNNLRTYLHPADAVHQIFSNCISIPPVNSQIGSKNVISIETLAHVIAREFGVNVNVSDVYSNKVDNYVPLDVPEFPEKDFETGISEWRQWLEIA